MRGMAGVMLILLSPAKNMNFDEGPPGLVATKPDFLKEAREIATVAGALPATKLGKLMDISPKLAALNHDRFQAFRGDMKANGQKPAALAFNGEVYLGLNARTMTAQDFAYAQQHLRILSGLYGLLRPLDAIEPYRLEMGSTLKTPRGKNLYAYWGDSLALAINKIAGGHEDKTVVNLASNEYFSAVAADALKFPVVTASFKEEKDGKLRSLQFFAKRARGLMARWAIDKRAERADDLKDFSVDGYKFQPKHSGERDWLFTRPQPPLKGR
ncbi:MAG: peroxide stress protein YaaA [Parvularculaceae bacterium]|nr:peroxide stress protein YaaA [Parvularculaceae bacterium]